MKKGQILLITLLVLTILSIITVTLIVLNNRDVRQTVVSEKYENIYNVSETKLQEFIDKYNTKTALSTAATENASSGCTYATQSFTYIMNCNMTLQTGDPSKTFQSELKISDEQKIENYTINKDRPIEINLSSYNALLDISWSKPAALEFTLFYDADANPSDSIVDIRIMKDVYDRIGLFDSATSQFTYSTLDPANPGTSTRLDLPNNANNLYLSITPRLPAGTESIEITVTPSDATTYPRQIRKYVSKSYDPLDSTSPVVNLITQIPLHPQTQGLFDYVLNTQDQIEILD